MSDVRLTSDEFDERRGWLERLLPLWLILRHLVSLPVRVIERKVFVRGIVYIRAYGAPTDDPTSAADAMYLLLQSARLGPARVKAVEAMNGEEERRDLSDRTMRAPWKDLVVRTRIGWERELVAALSLLVRHGWLVNRGQHFHWLRAAPIPHLDIAGAEIVAPSLQVDIDLPMPPPKEGADGAGVMIAVIDLELDPTTLPADIGSRLTHESVTGTIDGWVTGAPPSLQTVTHGAAILTVVGRLAPASDLTFVGLRAPTAAHLPVALEIARERGAKVVNLSFTAREAPISGAHATMCALMDETLEILQVPEGRQATEAVLGGWEYRRGVVAPTGNIRRGGRRSPMGWPASSPWVIGVGGVRNDLTSSRGARFGGKRGNDPDQWWVMPCGDRIGARVLEPCVFVNGRPNAGTSFAAAAASALLARALTGRGPADPITSCFVETSVRRPRSYRRSVHGRGLFPGFD